MSFAWAEGREGVEQRGSVVAQAFHEGQLRLDQPPTVVQGRIRFEVAGEAVDVLIHGGVPTGMEDAAGPADFAIIVDDWARVIPLTGAAVPLSEVRDCRLRFGDRVLPLPVAFEADHYTPEVFEEQVINALLYFFAELHGTPIGSVALATLFDDGRPRYVGDAPEPDEEMPKLAMAYSWPRNWEYRRGRAHQLVITEGAGIVGNWKDLLAFHGLYDQPGYGRIYAQYPELPDVVLDYCRVLAEVAKLQPTEPEESAVPDPFVGGEPPEPDAG